MQPSYDHLLSVGAVSLIIPINKKIAQPFIRLLAIIDFSLINEKEVISIITSF